MIILTIVVVYVITLFLISIYANRLVRGNTAEYLLANRNLPFWIVSVMITGLAIGGASTIGVAENAYNVGLAAGWYSVAWAAGAALMGFFGAPAWRRMAVSTIPEMLGNYYGPGSRIMGVILQIVITMVITCLQFVAGGTLLSSMLPEYFTLNTGMILTALVFIGITAIGGLWAGGLSNVINVTVIWIGSIVGMIMSWERAGGTYEITSKLPEGVNYLSPIGGLSLGVLFGWFMVMITQSFSVQATEQIAFAARDPREARRGFLMGACLMAPVGFFAAVIGIASRSMFPDISAIKALPMMIMSLPAWVSGLVLSGLWAADISTGCALLLGVTTLFEKDIFEWSMRTRNRDVSQRAKMWVSRALVLALGGVCLLMALRVSGILETLLIGLSLCTPFTIIFLFTSYAPSFCKKPAASFTILAGTILLFAWILLPDIRVLPHPIYLEWMVCLPVFLAVSYLSRDKIK